jgi:hypothetical protein
LAALGSAYLNQGMYEDAIAAHERLVEITPSGKWLLAVTYALTGRAGKARAIATELETQPTPWNAYGLAQIYGTLGDSDRAFEWLSYEPNHAWLPWIRSMEVPRRSWLARFHDDPRYRALLDRMRLPPPQTKAVASQSKSAS